VKDLFDFLHKIAKTFISEKLTINIHKGNVGKVQITQIIKNLDFKGV
jgi:hypothetical protein